MRSFLPVLGLLAVLAAPAAAQVPAHATEERVLGNPDAPVTIIEYASLTCPHCADFHSGILPELKKRFIEGGKVRLVMRDFPLDRVALQAHTIARCAPKGQYFPLLDALFRSQDRWARAANPTAALAGIARLSGMTEETIGACLNSEALQRSVLEDRLTGERMHQVQSTPTFVINGRTLVGARSIDAFADAIEDALGSPKGT